MDNPIERRPNAIHCRRTIFCRTAFLLTTIGSTVCACMPGDTVPKPVAAENVPRTVLL